MTPHELSLYVNAFTRKKETEGDNWVINAYLAAYWQRAKKMPSIKEVLKKPAKKSKQQTPEEMLEAVKKLNAAFGGGTSG